MIPISYQDINLYNSVYAPSSQHAKDSIISRMYQRYLFQKAISVFKFEGIPDNWDIDYFTAVLFSYGYIAVFDSGAEYGIIPQIATLHGYNIYRVPNKVNISNPLLNNFKTLEIGTECILIKLQPNYSGILDIVTYYADLLALSAEALAMNISNSKLSYVFMADGKVKAESLKKLYDEVARGEVAVFADKNLYKNDGSQAWDVFNQNIKNNYIASELIADMHRLTNMFNTDIGIPNANFEKSDRLITDEVNANNVDTQAKVMLWLETINRGLEEVNNKYGLNIKASLRFDYEENKENETKEETIDNKEV